MKINHEFNEKQEKIVNELIRSNESMNETFANRNWNHAHWIWEECNVEITDVYHTDSLMETSFNRDSNHTRRNREECYTVENDVYRTNTLMDTSLNRDSNHTRPNPKEYYNFENDVCFIKRGYNLVW